jgi:hypothetical protein
MIREIRRHGWHKGWRVWWTWASADDIDELTWQTRTRRWIWRRVFRQRFVHVLPEGRWVRT